MKLKPCLHHFWLHALEFLESQHSRHQPQRLFGRVGKTHCVQVLEQFPDAVRPARLACACMKTNTCFSGFFGGVPKKPSFRNARASAHRCLKSCPNAVEKENRGKFASSAALDSHHGHAAALHPAPPHGLWSSKPLAFSRSPAAGNSARRWLCAWHRGGSQVATLQSSSRLRFCGGSRLHVFAQAKHSGRPWALSSGPAARHLPWHTRTAAQRCFFSLEKKGFGHAWYECVHAFTSFPFAAPRAAILYNLRPQRAARYTKQWHAARPKGPRSCACATCAWHLRSFSRRESHAALLRPYVVIRSLARQEKFAHAFLPSISKAKFLFVITYWTSNSIW